jgi:glycosyltransferase involved in cell wall biosynthesis
VRILLLSHSFPPLNAIASHRAYGWARAWSEMGHEVHVVTPVKYPIDGPFGLDLPMDGLTVHAVPYFWERRDGAAPSPPGAMQNARWSAVKRRTRALRNRLGPLGDVRMLLVPSLVRAGAALAARLPFDLLVSNFGPASTLIAGSILARKTGLPWVVDYQDLWSGNYAARRGGRAGRIGTTVERALTRHAAMVVTLSQGLRKRLEETLGREAVVIYFGYLDDGDPPAPRPRAEQGAHLVYAGRVYERLQTAARFFRCAGRALARRPDLAEHLRVDFFGPDQAVLQQMADQHGAAPIIHLNGAVAWQEAVAIGRDAEALLFFDWLDPDAEGVLPGKLFEYLRSGRPIVFIGSGAETEAAQLARRSGAAIVLQSDAAIEQLLLDWSSGIPSLARDESFIAELSCKHQARRLLAEIERRGLTSRSATASAHSSSSRSSSTSR